MVGIPRKIMGIRLGEEPTIFQSVARAAGYTGVSATTVYNHIENGKPVNGWCFDEPLDEPEEE